jgi:hypothetical protein
LSASARDAYSLLSDLGRGLLPASRDPVKEWRTARIIDFVPHPTRFRVVDPDEVAAALEPKPPSGEH